MSKFKVGDVIVSNSGPDVYTGHITHIDDDTYQILWTSNGWPTRVTDSPLEYIDSAYNIAVKLAPTAPNDVQQVDCENTTAYVDCSDNLD